MADYVYKIVPVIVLSIGFYFVFREKCHNFEPAVQSHLGNKSPYRAVANFNSEPFNFSGCTAVKILSVIRHGTRTPKSKLIRAMRTRLNEIRLLIINNIDTGEGELCPEMKIAFQNWEFNLSDDSSQLLTEEGEEEMFLLGERMQMRFPEVLSDDYSNESYQFRYTATQRTAESARFFTIGLFGRQVSNLVWYPEAVHKDSLLRFYKLCEKWKKTVSKNPTTYEEQRRFSQSDEIKNAVVRISKRLGLQSVISFEDAFLMYQMCCFDTAWSSLNVSPWCGVLTHDEAQVFEFYEELNYYWKDGYGNSLNYEQACPLFNDMINHFESKSPLPKGIFYFTHSGTLLKMLGFLGLYKDKETLLASNYKKLSERQWKVSKIDAFGTNLAFVLYKCTDGTDKILVLHQEHPVRLHGCPADYDLCPLSTIKDVYKGSISNCNFNEMCSIGSS